MVGHARSGFMVNLFNMFLIRDAWSAVKGTSEDEAKKAYVAKLIAVRPATTLLSDPITHLL